MLTACTRPVAWLLLASCGLALVPFAGVASAGTEEPSTVAPTPALATSTPPAAVIEALDRQIGPRDRLFVSTLAWRREARAAAIGPTGLSGVTAVSGAPLPAEIAWPEITRLEARDSHRTGGLVLGGTSGALAGGFFAGTAGLVVGAAAGAWVVGAIGDRWAHARLLWTAAPAGATVPLAATPDGVPPKAFVPSDDTLAALRRHASTSAWAVSGPFGEFAGRVATVEASGLSGLVVDPGLDRGVMIPAEPLDWGQITRIDRRGNSAGRGAVIGGLLLGTAGGIAAGGITSIDHTDNGTIAQNAAAGAVTGLVLGACIGALAGLPFPAWHRIY